MICPDYLRVIVFRLCCLAAFVAAMWLVHGLNWMVGYNLTFMFGLTPRELSGLDGVIAMPFLHGGMEHLMANTPPTVLMGALLAATATRALIVVNVIIVLLGGALVWLFGAPAIHIGASGLIFGWFGFLIARGLVDRSPVTLGASLLVGLFYGSMIWGVFPGQPGVSWEAHLFGALAGAAAAFMVRTHVHNPRMRNVERRS